VAGAPWRVGGLEIDDQLELRGLLDRQISRLGDTTPLEAVARMAAGVGLISP
jgi:hypothetical protein